MHDHRRRLSRDALQEGARHRAPSWLVSFMLLALLAAVLTSGARAAQQPQDGDAGLRPVVVEVRDGGFHWADAGVGAAAALAAALAVAAAVLVRSGR